MLLFVDTYCEVCGKWDFSVNLAPVKPFLMRGSAHFFLCPNCQNVVVDDFQAEKAGATYRMTKKQLKERYGIDITQFEE